MKRQDYREALEVQDACNLCGVAQSFAAVMLRLTETALKLGESTDWVNTHPITRAWASKISDLAGSCTENNWKVLLHFAKLDAAERITSSADRRVV